jgi:xyloglucan fucosyltransferase
MKYTNTDERLGVQVRVFKWAPISVDELHGQILACVQRENILLERRSVRLDVNS